MAALGMSEPAAMRTNDARYRDRRVDERFEIDISGGCINYQGKKFPCRIVDVSLSGCCVRTESSFLPGNLANVEVVLPILGMVLRMVGTTQWVTRSNLIGIRFLHPSSRSKNQLAGLLTCLVDQEASEEVKAAVIDQVQSGGTDLDVEVVEPRPKTIKPTPVPPTTAPGEVGQTPQPSLQPAQVHRSIRRRQDEASKQDGEDWPAVLRLLKDGSRHSGVLSNLSLEACYIQTATPFIAGIHIRVEVDFQVCGLHFLLGGVIDDVRNKNLVEIRFLEMSFRKRQELADVIEELRLEADRESAA